MTWGTAQVSGGKAQPRRNARREQAFVSDTCGCFTASMGELLQHSAMFSETNDAAKSIT